MLTQFPRLRLVTRGFLFLILCGLLWTLLPYDNGLVLLFRWHFNNAHYALTSNNAWLFDSPVFPLDRDEIGLIVKTGFSTQNRLLPMLDVFQDAHLHGNIVLVGDYSTAGLHSNHSRLQLPVYNALASMVESGYLVSRPDAPRLQYYSDLTAAISDGNTELAHTIGQTHGWELDIMKHISGLELGYKLMPHKKWYVLLDDDTYLLNTSLKSVLERLDPSVLYYIGNAVGDYKARFAHGGSAVVFSRAAMDRIFLDNTEVVSRAHLESLDARFGDKLIATTAMKTGIYLDERHVRHFNGEPPRATRIQRDRFCVPIISFHNMSPSQMLDARKMFEGAVDPISWIDVWNKYKAPALDNSLVDPIRSSWDHVGRLDEATMTVDNVKSKEQCLQICNTHGSTCLAWTWEANSLACHVSPWMIVGEAADGKTSGINTPKATSLQDDCS